MKKNEFEYTVKGSDRVYWHFKGKLTSTYSDPYTDTVYIWTVTVTQESNKKGIVFIIHREIEWPPRLIEVMHAFHSYIASLWIPVSQSAQE